MPTETSTATSPSYAGTPPPTEAQAAATQATAAVSVTSTSGAADLADAVAKLKTTVEDELSFAKDGLEKAAAGLVSDLTSRLNGTQSLLTAGIAALEAAAQAALTKM